jgi:hypothetical protein
MHQQALKWVIMSARHVMKPNSAIRNRFQKCKLGFETLRRVSQTATRNPSAGLGFRV